MSRKTKDFLLIGHDQLISFVNKSRFCHVSLTLYALQNKEITIIMTNLNFKD